MATRTFTNGGVNNLWSTAGNWDTPPVDNDTVVIAAGQTCEYDADWSSAVTYPNGINGMTITGTLKISKTVSSYMKMKAATIIAGAGIFNIGESGVGNNIPFAVKFTLTGGAGWKVNGSSGLRITCYAAEPTIKYINTTGLEAIGATVLEVGTNVTGDYWSDGDIVLIVQKARGGTFTSYEKRVIAAGGIAAGSITITVGLTAAKEADTYIVLISRNVVIDASAGATETFYNLAHAGDLVIAGGLWKCNPTNNYNTFSTANNAVFTGGVIYEGFIQFDNANYSSFTNVVFASAVSKPFSGGTFDTITNCLCFGNGYSSLQLSTDCTLTGNLVVGSQYGIWASVALITNCTVINASIIGIINCNNATIVDCTVMNNATGFAQNYLSVIKNLTLIGNTAGIILCYGSKFFNVTMGTIGTAPTSYNGLLYDTMESFDDGGVAGGYQAFIFGGNTILQNSILPVGYVYGFTTTLLSASWSGYFKRNVTVPAGKSVTIDVALRKSASMTYLPRIYLALFGSNPDFITPVDSFTMTNSIDTWETDSFTIDNSLGTKDLFYTLWFVGKNASGNFNSAYKLNMGGGGSVKILPVSGSVGL